MSDPRAHIIYTKLLLRRGHGYPLWIPESDYNLPDVYRDKGVSVGDLGILTDDGGFDFLFNVCAEADDPVHQGHVPPQFQPLRISSNHAIRKIPFHRKNSSITSAHVSKTTIAVEGSAEMTPFVTGGGGFEFSTSKAEAAILMLPDGGNRYDTVHRSLFKQYVAENALSWYIYVNSLDQLAREAPNGSLYLVTGCDKARSWMTAAASRPSESHTISVKFAIGPIMEGRIALQTSWSTPYIDADTRIYPDYPEPMPQQDNQCVFMRGFTITVRENSLMQKVLGPVQLKVIGGSSRNAAPSFSSRSPYSSYQDNLVGSSSSGVLSSTGPVDNFDIPDSWTNEDPKSLLKDNIELIDLPGRSTELLNPSVKINEHLLTLYPHITVAVTHDEDWMEVTKDLPPDQWPDDFKLASMVLGLPEKRSTESLTLNGKDSVALPERDGSGPSLVAGSSSYDSGNTALLNPGPFLSPVPSGPPSLPSSNPPQPLTNLYYDHDGNNTDINLVLDDTLAITLDSFSKTFAPGDGNFNSNSSIYSSPAYRGLGDDFDAIYDDWSSLSPHPSEPWSQLFAVPSVPRLFSRRHSESGGSSNSFIDSSTNGCPGLRRHNSESSLDICRNHLQIFNDTPKTKLNFGRYLSHNNFDGPPSLRPAVSHSNPRPYSGSVIEPSFDGTSVSSLAPYDQQMSEMSQNIERPSSSRHDGVKRNAHSHNEAKRDATFMCPFPDCGSTFTRSFNLNSELFLPMYELPAHLNLVHMCSHSEEKPFVCSWPGCGKSFAQQHDCNRHEKLHSNYRLFSRAEEDSSDLDNSDVDDDFPSYFVESNGRLFHSSPTCPYPLPIDTPEQQRLNVIHNALFSLIGTHYVGPVPELLMSEPGRLKIVVDMCTGTGKWVMNMAELYPHVRFYGLDIVPIATRYPFPNVTFKLHDVAERTRYQDGSIDLVHARSVFMTVRDYGKIIQEVKRILRPGGMFVSGEWGQHPSFHPSYNLDPASETPSLLHFFQVLRSALARCGIPPVAGNVHARLQSAGGFADITHQIHYLPIGSWSNDHIMQRIGKAFRTVLSRYMDSVRPIILELGINESDLDHLYADARAEVASTQGLVAVYYSVHARRM
ncbi:uncharacterized protein ARMOST_13284 [Armillaria ostoyae]|uniref:C2H2-type domain-containing protein n=1 Tax=Armillaria ostoyae TaxID=47428 RepID=A0A284RMB2_ARMOS|nr:uncharacterized protein ARMOST_13284 [Armillaria ostoyae]